MKKFPISVIRIVTIVFASLLCFFIVGNNVADTYASVINHALQVKTSKIINVEDDNTDTAYFKSNYSTNTFDEFGRHIYDEQGEGESRLIKDAEDLCIEVEGEGLVLLKNDNNALPLTSSDKVSLFGQGAANFNYSSTGSSAASTTGYANFKTAVESVGLSVNTGLWGFYTTGEGKAYTRTQIAINEAPWSLISSVNGSEFANYGDAAIFVISRNSGEGQDVPAAGTDGANGNYLALSQNERDILTNLTDLKENGVFKKIVVILNMANPLQLDFLTDDAIDVDACLWVGNVGKTGIYAVARALVGEIVPSGKLSDTYVYDNFSSPAMASWALNENKRFAQRYYNLADNTNGTQSYYGVYVEGIYVGYRYYETRYEDVVLGAANVGDYDYSNVVAYPFGYGLSYAQFNYSKPVITENADSFDVSVTVTNTSNQYNGKEVVQVYLQKPYDPASGLETASIELVGYAKTQVLEKNGDSETVTITISKEQLTSYDVNSNAGKGGYVLSKGDYYLAVGKDAHDALNNVLAAKASKVSVNENKMTAEGNADYTYSWNLSERDEISYAASKETGNIIKNQLDFADINRYENRGENSVTYLSRSNWVGTWPLQSVVLTRTEGMEEDIAVHKELPTETTEELPQYGQTNNITLIMLRSSEDNVIDYNDSSWDAFLDQMTYEDQSYLITNAAMGTVELKHLGKTATYDNDGPTGVVRSKTGTSFPSEGIWASSYNVELIKRVGEMLAEDALFNGYVSLYATGINIHRTPFGGRAHEYFSEDPFLTGYSVCYEVEGMQSKGVIPTLKHYAFNDEEDQRGGICIWLNEQEAREIMLKPFEMAMRPSMGNSHAIMTSFNRAGCIWTSASSELMINISRNEWGFDGYSITDMTNSFTFYMTHDDGIMNGTDIYLGAGDEYALSDYAGSIPFRLRMREACHRLFYVLANYSAAMNGLSASSRIISITPWWKIAIYVAIGVAALITAISVSLWVAYYVINFKKRSKKEN